MNFDTTFPMAIGSRCINKDWFGMPMPEVWAIMETYLHFCSHAYNLQIHLFVLMSNHYHMIASAPDGNLADSMQFFQAQTSRQITKNVGRINHLWKAHFHRTKIVSHHYYLHAYKYFYLNPVAAGICRRVEEYPYSTLQPLLGFSQSNIPIVEDVTLFSDVEGTLAWLNTPPKETHAEMVRRALRRQNFKLPRSPSGGANDLEKILY